MNFFTSRINIFFVQFSRSLCRVSGSSAALSSSQWAQCGAVHLRLSAHPGSFCCIINVHPLLPSFKQPVGTSGLEPPTSRLSGVRSNHLSYAPIQWPSVLPPLPQCSRLSFFWKTSGGDEEVRTPDPLRAKQVLSQLSYTPICIGFSSHP